MSFSQMVKKELVEQEYSRNCCRKAQLYGMCIFGKSFSSRGVSLQTENMDVARLYQDLLMKICHVKATITVSPKGRSANVSVDKSDDCKKIMRFFGHDGRGSLKIDYSNFEIKCKSCIKAFISGAFLSCGTVSNPDKDYHLEFTVPYVNLAKSFITMMVENELAPKLSNRKGYNIVYFKESEAIEQCLYLMGASSAMFEMMNVKIVKDIRNGANRKANCETANIERMVNAVGSQLEAIEYLKSSNKFELLTPPLKTMANIRLDNPDSSLRELSELSGLSRSGVNHRLSRLVEIAQKEKSKT